MIKVRFVSVSLRLPTVETQAIRIYHELNRLFPDEIGAEISLLSTRFFSPERDQEQQHHEIAGLVRDMDVVVLVKHSLFQDFAHCAALLREICSTEGTVLVAHPCDGPGADGGEMMDAFTKQLADYVLTVSSIQARDFKAERAANEIILLDHASRIEGDPPPVTIREQVKQVVWENPVHHNPGQAKRTLGGELAEFVKLESVIQEVCQRNGVQLTLIKAWTPPQKYPQWEQAMRDADIAIECKALHKNHGSYQAQKSAVKVINYLALGLPVVCDSLPSYRELGKDGQVMMFADTLQQWEQQLTRLFTDFALRQRLSAAGLQVARRFHIDNVCAQYLAFFKSVLAQ